MKLIAHLSENLCKNSPLFPKIWKDFGHLKTDEIY